MANVNFNTQALENALKGFQKSIPVKDIENVTKKTVTELQAVSSTASGKTVGEIKGGFKSVTQEIDHPVKTLEERISDLKERGFEANDPAYNQSLQSEISGSLENLSGVMGKVGRSMNEPIKSLEQDFSKISNEVQDLNTEDFAEEIGQTFKPVIGVLTEELPANIKEKLIPSISPVSDDLENLTGKPVQSGLLDNVIASPTPQGIQKALQTTAEALPAAVGAFTPVIEDLEPLFKDVVVPQLQKSAGKLSDIVKQSDFKAKVTEKVKIASQLNIDAADFGGIKGQLKQMSEGIGANLRTGITNITGNPKLDLSSFKQAVQNIDTGKFKEAAQDFKKVSDRSIEDIQTELSKIDLSVADQLKIEFAENSLLKPPVNVKDNGVNWETDRENSDTKFTYVGIQELEADLVSIERDVTELIVESTDTEIDRNIGSEEIHQFFNILGFNIPYHYVIRRDGTIQRGLPVEQVAENFNLPVKHAKKSITVAMVGGFNCLSNEEDPESFASSQSYTDAQYKSFKKFIEKYYTVKPGGQVFAISEVNPERGRAAPYFNVEGVINSIGKFNVIIDPEQEEPYSGEKQPFIPLPRPVFAPPEILPELPLNIPANQGDPFILCNYVFEGLNADSESKIRKFVDIIGCVTFTSNTDTSIEISVIPLFDRRDNIYRKYIKVAQQVGFTGFGFKRTDIYYYLTVDTGKSRWWIKDNGNIIGAPKKFDNTLAIEEFRSAGGDVPTLK